MKGYIDRLAGVFREIVLFCNAEEIDEGTLPNYLDAKDVGWWADTFYAVYTAQMARAAKEIAANHSSPDYFALTVKRCEGFPAHRGYVLDDVHKRSAQEFESVVSSIRLHSSKPIVASFTADFDIAPYLPTILKHKSIFVARQLYRQDAAGERNRDDRTSIVTKWLSRNLCDVANLEYFQDGTVITSADDLGAMYHRCLDAGVKAFMGYASVDVEGFKVWEHPELWAMVKQIAGHFEQMQKLP